jgi:hypothetical protein
VNVAAQLLKMNAANVVVMVWPMVPVTVMETLQTAQVNAADQHQKIVPVYVAAQQKTAQTGQMIQADTSLLLQ